MTFQDFMQNQLYPGRFSISRFLPLVFSIFCLALLLFSRDGKADSDNHSANVKDPGVRSGPSGAGGPLPGLNSLEIGFFNGGLARFNNIDAVANGLGPRYNGDSCAACHAQPAVGGSTPAVNPQIALSSQSGAQNSLPSFITLDGPVRVARFVNKPDGTADGGVHNLFVISGRSDAPGCKITQPDFETELNKNNVIFRIPTPLFGLGLVENVSDLSLQANLAANAHLKAQLGISGRFNTSANDGTITRFGWKAQNKSLLLFAGEAYNVEIGVTNDLFPNKRETNLNCQYNPLPEDTSNLTNTINSGSPVSDYASDIINFAAFARLSAAPQAASPTPQSVHGKTIFENIGCQLCHTETFVTAQSTYTAQSNVSFNPFSDFALHAMGDGLADGISQGVAGGSEFRSAPLWGLGQRIYFLHDGRTDDLVEAIRQHASSGSEANAVIQNYKTLSPNDQQDLLVFCKRPTPPSSKALRNLTSCVFSLMRMSNGSHNQVDQSY